MRQLNVPTPGFGITLHTAIQSGLDQATEALDAEQLGYDVVTLHRDALHGDDPSFENWTLLTWLAAQTTRISMAPLVLALPHRHPAVLAKMAETTSAHRTARSMHSPCSRALRKSRRGRGMEIACGVCFWETTI